MSGRTFVVAFLFFVSGLCQAQSPASCDQWTFFNTFTPDGIDRYGTVVGYGVQSDGSIDGYIRYADGTTKLYAYSGASGNWTLLSRRNASGLTVGYYRDVNQYSHGLALYGSKQVPLNFPDHAVETILYGVNDLNTIVGIYGYGDFSQPYDGFQMTQDGTFTVLAYPGAEMTNPMNINDAGTIVGWWVPDQAQPPFPDYGFTLTNGSYQELDYPNVDRTFLNDINSSGVIAGSYQDTGTGAEGGFLYENGNFLDIINPTTQVQSVVGINDSGFVTGTSTAGSFIAHCQ